ncbi:Stk1 family PASTA domain-containing Ser/Thr kinase [Butyrivibrio sp. X503]|uniref:Stk1 family PASTA domain-containing Ser/Thr kinase n=1 Tax=Butyrivibrio sp. X503 TaxID=2364878 RepID=UPI000EA92DE2|nr:Stk1 family PASTA domain-containing Ser/Thr kinase [Butyrivibrio sp. X503]RKM56464.1 Stk1 family PASTA domain-containing Ser/Thr kinase [Butyrivibrio sp. X503]
MIKIGMVIGDRYEVLEKIGTGGMSDVYKAKDHKLNRLVAVKVLKQEFSENENFVSKFRVEAQSTAGLMHPNIVNVYDVGDEDGINYIVMELVDGITLKKYIEKKARLSVKEAVSIAIQVAMGLEAAHNNNIIHRDIKPQNIMISKDGKVKVTDFGIAKAATSNTITSNVMGSVHYTSPEQARGGYSDAKSDIYSLGITLFEMLTGRVPFNGDTTVAIAIKHIQEDLPTPADYNDEIPISVEKIVLKCCQKSPDRRYQSAAELITDLKRSLITPDKDFVSLADPDEEGATRVAHDEPVGGHSETASMRLSETEQMRLREESYKNRRDDRYDDDYEPRRKKPQRDYEDELDDDYYYERERERRRSSFDPQSGKIEKMTVGMAVFSAIIIGLIVIMLVARGMGLFGSPEDASASASSSASASTEASDDKKSGGIQVPDVTGKSYAEAKLILADEKHLKVEKEADSENTAPKDTVVSTKPAAGEKVNSGDTVTVYISNGSNYKASAQKEEAKDDEGKVAVPNVIGMDSEEAVITLVEAGLQEGRTVDVNNDDTNLTGKICNQSPTVGTMVEKGTMVNMEHSIGPANVKYSFKGSIDAPPPGKGYTPGTPVRVEFITSDGKSLLNTETTEFPIANLEYNDLTSPTGRILYKYTVTTPVSTNPDTGEQTGGQTTEVVDEKAVEFNQRN